MRRLASAAFLALCLPFAGVGAQGTADPATASRQAYREAVTAYRASEHDAFLRHVRRAAALRPNHPTFTYALATAYALTGDTTQALYTLRSFAEMGLTADPSSDADFASIRTLPGFEELAEQMRANGQPVGASEVAFGLEDRAFAPEGIAYDSAEDTFYLGSLTGDGIVRVREGAAELFATAEAASFWSVLGLVVDPARRWLWACTSALEQATSAAPGACGRAALVAFDLATGQRVQTWMLADTAQAHVLGDLALDLDDEAVYVSDAATGALYVLVTPEGALREVAVLDTTLSSPQGLAFSRDGRHLFVADYALGLFRLDTHTRAASAMPYPPNTSLLGIDGLVYHEGALYAIQNGVRPQRVLRLALSDDEDLITGVEVLEAANVHFDEPTLGVVAGDALYYVANSPWPHFDADGRLRLGEVRAPVVLRLELP